MITIVRAKSCSGVSFNARWFHSIISIILVIGMVFSLPAQSVQASSLLNASFTTSTDGFLYQDDTFGTSKPSYASGSRITGSNCYGATGGCLNVRLGGVDSTTVTNMSGGWKYTFSLPSAITGLSLSLRYRLVMPSAYIYDEFSRVQVSLDGVLFGRGSRAYVDHTGGDGNFAHDSGWLQTSLFLGDLAAGTHTLILGGFSNKKTSSTKITDIYLDDVALTSENPAPAPSATQLLVDRLNLANFKTNIQSVAAFGDRCRNSTSCAPYTSFNNAQNWVEQQLQAMGYATFKHNYTYSGWTGSNLYATKTGSVYPNQMYIISGHLDGRGGGGGADDDGSAVSLILEIARVLASPDVQTDYSVRFLFFDQEEIGLYGSNAYVSNRRSLQGTAAEPTWLGIIQHDMILYDHGVGTVSPSQSVYADLDVEWRDGTTYAAQSKTLAQAWRFYNGTFASQYPANSANYSTNTDDTPFQPYTAAISVRENRRNLSGEWINPYYHKTTDIYNNYSEADFALGFNAVQTTLSTVAELAGASILSGNTAPTADPQSLSTPEDTPLSITLTASDPEGDPLSFSIVSAPAHGALSGSAPALLYTPAPDFNGSDSFTFKASDGSLDSSPATVSISVSPVNDPPSAFAQSLSTPEDMPLSITLTGSDPDGDGLSFSIVSAPAHGALSGSAPNLLYTPAPDFNGSDSFTFKVSDGSLDSSPVTVSLSVTPVNDPPTAFSQEVAMDEDTAIGLTLTGSDPESNPLSYMLVNNPAHGVLSGTAPDLTYLPAENYYGADSFQFAVSDGGSTSAPALVNLLVAPLNDAPVALQQSVATQQEVPVALKLTGTDVDGDSLAYNVVTSPIHGALSGAAPDLTYTPEVGFVGEDSLTFTVSDGQTTSPEALVLLSVTRTNHQPVADSQSLMTMEETMLPIELTGSDPDGDPITFTLIASPAHGELSGNAPSLTYLPYENYSGEDSFSFVVNDGLVDSQSATVSISVGEVNDAPMANAQTLSTSEDSELELNLTGSDVEGAPLSFYLTSNPTHGVLYGTLPALTYVPETNYFGADSLSFRVFDGELESLDALVSITIAPVNDPPVASPQSVSTNEDTPQSLTLSGSDVEGDPLSFVIVSPPAHGTLSGSAPALTYAPAANYFGTDSFTFKVSDGSQDSAPVSVPITISAVNDAPVANAQSVTTAQDTAKGITLTASDIDGDALTYTIVTLPAHGSLSGTAPNLTYTPASGYSGSDSFSFSVADGQLSSNTATVSITVTPSSPLTVFSDNFETNLGWTRNPIGTDTATLGVWERANPATTSSSGYKQLGTTASGSYDLVTGPLAGTSAGSYDIDGGLTSMRSPSIILPAGRTLTLTLKYYLAHGSNSSTADYLRISVVGSTTTVMLQELGATNDDDAAWATLTYNLSSYAGQTVTILIQAADASGASLVEAAVDDVLIVAK